MPQTTVEVPDLSKVSRIVEEWLERRDDDLDAGEFGIKVITILNGKGGVGKTSFAVAWAVMLASIGKKVLYVEMDPQGNACEDLGIVADDALNDNGAAQVEAVLGQKGFVPTGEARPNLFVVPGGSELERLITELYFLKRISQEEAGLPWRSMYVCSVEQCFDDYDVIVLDVAPGYAALQTNALQATDGLVIPTRSDPSSRKGLRTVAARVAEAREDNDVLTLLGVLLFATNSSAKRVQQQIRDDLARDLGGDDHLLPHVIRYVESAAVEARRLGKTPQEIIQERPAGMALESMTNLAADYSAVTTSLLERVTRANQALNSSDNE